MVKTDKIVKAFFRNTQVGILVKVKDRRTYHGLIPIMGEPRTMRIVQRQAGLKK